MKRSLTGSAIAVALALAASPAFAHDDAYLDTLEAPHGGQLRMAGPWHYELVTASDAEASGDSPLVVYVTDHAGAPVSTAGATGTATILSGKVPSTAALTPDGGNRMKGVSRHARTPGAKIVVSITLPGKAPGQARFTPGSAAAHPMPMQTGRAQ
ncbi:MAG: hypothetical protein M9907_17325 [Burkholderiaceae bacterium]|nr:hypothetical protein [Burkholderiaceae bacterium]